MERFIKSLNFEELISKFVKRKTNKDETDGYNALGLIYRPSLNSLGWAIVGLRLCLRTIFSSLSSCRFLIS